MDIQHLLTLKVNEALKQQYNTTLEAVEFQATRKEFEGDITIVVFPMLRVVKTNPVQLGSFLGDYLVEHVVEITAYNVVKGFLNLVIDDAIYITRFNQIRTLKNFGVKPLQSNEKAVMVEYSSPNTNKPLHLGHIRNNLLGYAVAEIIKASGKKVYKTQIINDRGIHICKSMLAWERYGNGETPASTGLKGDKLVGNYYVKFEQLFQEEFSEWIASAGAERLSEFAAKEHTQKSIQSQYAEKLKLQEISLEEAIVSEFKKAYKNDYFTSISPLGLAAKEMLLKWEAGDEATVLLWKKMNQWVYDGFEVTYKNLGVTFDSYYYESNTYLLGKDNIAEGLKKGVFFKKEDGSVWCDLTDEGLDEKIVLRSDGTAVYMTQDIGTAIQRVKDNPDVGAMIYTVGNEQD